LSLDQSDQSGIIAFWGQNSDKHHDNFACTLPININYLKSQTGQYRTLNRVHAQVLLIVKQFLDWPLQ